MSAARSDTIEKMSAAAHFASSEGISSAKLNVSRAWCRASDGCGGVRRQKKAESLRAERTSDLKEPGADQPATIATVRSLET